MSPSEVLNANLNAIRFYEQRGLKAVLKTAGATYYFGSLEEQDAIDLLGRADCNAFISINASTNTFAVVAKTKAAIVVAESREETSPIRANSLGTRKIYLYSRPRDWKPKKKRWTVSSPCGTADFIFESDALVPLPGFRDPNGKVEWGYEDSASSEWYRLPELKPEYLEQLERDTLGYFPPDLKPLPSVRVESKRVPNEMYPEAFRAFIVEAGPRLKTHPEYIFSCLMAGAGRLPGDKVVIQGLDKNKDFQEHPINFWMNLGDSGWKKTAAHGAGLAPLDICRQKRKERMAEEVDRKTRDRAVLSLRIESVDRALKRSADFELGLSKKKIDVAALTEKRKQLEDDLKKCVILNLDYCVKDVTRERLEEILAVTPNGVIGRYDEFGWIMDELNGPNGHKWRELFQGAWYGNQEQDTQRMSRNLRVDKMLLSVCAATQPDTYVNFQSDLIRRNRSNDGMEARFIKIYPTYRPIYTIKDVKRAPNKEAFEQVMKVFTKLDLDTLVSDLGIEEKTAAGAAIVKYSPDAQKVFDTFYDRLDRLAEKYSDRQKNFAAFIDKGATIAARLSLLFHLIAWADDQNRVKNPALISEETVRLACDWCELFIIYARCGYGLSDKPEVFAAKSILKKIKAGLIKDGSNIRDSLTRAKYPDLRGESVIEGGLSILEACNYIRIKEVGDTGRKARFLLVHPEIQRAIAEVATAEDILDDDDYTPEREQKKPPEFYVRKWAKGSDQAVVDAPESEDDEETDMEAVPERTEATVEDEPNHDAETFAESVGMSESEINSLGDEEGADLCDDAYVDDESDEGDLDQDEDASDIVTEENADLEHSRSSASDEPERAAQETQPEPEPEPKVENLSPTATKARDRNEYVVRPMVTRYKFEEAVVQVFPVILTRIAPHVDVDTLTVKHREWGSYLGARATEEAWEKACEQVLRHCGLLEMKPVEMIATHSAEENDSAA